MTTEEKQARDAEVAHWQAKTEEAISFWTARCNDVVAENTNLRERAEKAEAVVSAARAYRENYDKVILAEQWRKIRHALLDAIDDYDAPAQEGE